MTDPLRRFLPSWLRAPAPPPRTTPSVDPDAAAQAFFERRIADAARLFVAAVTHAESYGPLDPRLATALNNLAEFYRVQGEFGQAEPFYRRAITIDEQALGAEHPHLARDLNNLALLYRAQGRYHDAEPLCRRALNIKDKTQGSDDSGIMTVIQNLLAVYLAQGKYADAEPLYRRALSLKARTFGPDHPTFTTSLSNYSALVRKTRGEAEAVKLENAVLHATDSVRRERPRMTLVAGRAMNGHERA